MKRETLKAVLVAIVRSKAFWKLTGAVALLAGLTIPEGLLELVSELVREVLAEVGTGIAAAVLTAPWVTYVAAV
ncbi:MULTISPECIES: hypothetical protein [Pseudomonas]|uniref:hypothetical protein n=1 Tax=Pseudomonas TaxID=286 RepID=UPI001473E0FC|nr:MULTISPECIES: hypothetical protein [Pseudomonas]MCU0209153.1 hypothetical protein [Pseudomonas shahriarae]NMY19014.1 hypothetical protein [Pseudomonas sp. WS 5410]